MKKKFSLARFFDEFVLAGKGALLAMKKKKFLITFLVAFLGFGTLLNLLATGLTSFQMMGAFLASGDFGAALKILWSAVIANFGIGKEFTDFILNFLLTVLQATLIALAAFVFKHNRKEKKETSGVEGSAIVAGLAVLGSGCPTCGTTLLAPLIGAVLSGTTGAVAMAGTLSMIFNILAIFIAILVFRKMGLQAYAIIKSEEFKEKKNEKSA